MWRWWVVFLGLVTSLMAGELPRPTFANSFCLFPINERFHLRAPGDRDKLVAWAAEMRAVLGPNRLYAPLGVAIISEGEEWELFEFCRQEGVQLVLQGGAIEHHAVAWGFPKLLRDPATGDRRFAQWFQDGLISDPGKEDQHDFGYRACASVYAKPVQDLRRVADRARSARIAASMTRYPDVVVACSGPIECEMHQGADRWGDHSPFTLAEFRDWLTHRGLYAPGGERAGQGYPGGAQWADDPAPDRAIGGNASFNATFGTTFTTWALRYWDPQRYPERLPLDAPGLPQPGQRGHIAGGFDAPRVWPGRPPLAGLAPEGNDRFWSAWASVDDARPGFRARLLNWWVGDHTRLLAEAGVPRERIFSHQIPGESYGLGRLSQGASMVWTAHTPHGALGITTYFGAASDVEVFGKLTALEPNWGIFEYHPHPIDALRAPVEEYLHSLWTCVRFRAHVLTPIDWTSEEKDFIVKTGPFAQAMGQVLAALPDQPYYDRAPIAYDPPAVAPPRLEAQPGNQVKLSWSPRIWADLKHVWTDWRDFDQFEVRAADGRLLGRTRETSLTVPGDGRGLRVVATRRALAASDQRIAGLTGAKGRLRWDEARGFFADRYEVAVYDTATAAQPSRRLTTREARLDLRPTRDEHEVWVTVAVGEGAPSPRYRLSLPRPGRVLLDLATRRPVVTNSPDTAFRVVSVGGVSQPALFQHPALQGQDWSLAGFSATLPQVAAGQRILFVADLGIKDGVTAGDGVRFALAANDRDRLEQPVKPGQAWQPVEIDLTDLAGQTLALVLKVHPNANSAADWAAWGDPRVLLVGPGVVDLPRVVGITALGKEVRGRVTLRWQEAASDGSLWARLTGFSGFRVYRGAERDFEPAAERRLGESKVAEYVDATFDGRETYYRVTAVLADGTESPVSEAVQYAP